MDIQTFINNYYEAFSLKAELPNRFLVFRFSAWRIKADTRLFIQGPSRYQARRDYQIPPFRKDRSINLV